MGEWGVGTHLALGRKDDVIIGPHDGASELAEDDGLLGHRHVLFSAVVRIVHAHAHHLVWPSHWGQERHLCPWEDWQVGGQCSAKTRTGQGPAGETLQLLPSFAF